MTDEGASLGTGRNTSALSEGGPIAGIVAVGLAVLLSQVARAPLATQ